MFKLTYYRRIQLSFLVLIFIPLIVVSTVSFLLIRGSMVEKLQLSNENFLNVMTDEMNKTVDDVTFASHFIVNDANVRANLKSFADTKRINNYNDYVLFTQIQDLFNLINTKPLNNNIRMYLVNRQHFVISSGTENLTGMNASVTQLMKRVDLNEPEKLQWLGMADSGLGNRSYYIARVIYDSREKQYVSVLLVSIAESYFSKLLSPVEFGKVAVFDSSGELISGNPELSLEENTESGHNVRTFRDISKSSWKLVYEASEKEWSGQISRTFYTGLIVVILLFLVFLMTSMVIAKRLHSPIHKLQRVVRQFGLGNLDVRLDIKGRDDIAELGRTLNTMLDQLQQLIHDIEQEQEQKRVMELEALFMQIRPHFLINTLNSIKCSLILQQDKLHSGIIDSLMSLLRAYLKVNEPTTLEEECKLLAHYVDIMKIRSEIPLKLEIDLEPKTKELIVPKLILQPLVENAIVHGFVDHPSPTIRVISRQVAGGIRIEIEDNGSGIEEETLGRLNRRLMFNDEEDGSYQRVGLINVVQRLRLTFGEEAAMTISNLQQGGTSVSLYLPLGIHHVFLSGGNE
ncbi:MULTISPECIES: cache domain-containing sensor histidine kinase [unclassified Paenibacillus]|uniref:cache domain-containing sensor histidine kinase n=1 Tax=unclassified Paenibacillus TaxID=185978 RepID=UPI000837EE23|nr:MULTISPECIES: sensor histidine kinase [unclassified Paenibacillus]NWL86570.1 HAMP domain-containing protein [Paenibacillus sp. 79R4]